MRCTLHPPISAAGKAQRRRRGEGERGGEERKTVRKGKEEQYGHKQLRQRVCVKLSSGLGPEPPPLTHSCSVMSGNMRMIMSGNGGNLQKSCH